MTAPEPRRGQLAGRVALVTGAAGGQGEAEARLFAAEGAAVVVADVLADQGAQLAEELTSSGANATFVELDVSDEQSWCRALASVEQHHGGLDILVNNAGVSDRRGVLDQDPASFSRVLGINLRGPVLGMRLCAPLMRRGGAIVNVCSIASLTGYDAAAYTASKWGLRGVSRTAAAALAASGVRVNCVMPGVIRTPMLSNASEQAISDFARLCAVPRAGEADEIARTVLHLVSDDAAYVIGAEVTIDGGFTAAGVQRALAVLTAREETRAP